MSTVIAAQPETRIVMRNVPWAVFDALSAGDRRSPRLVYDRGTLEIMSPSGSHEWYHKLLGRLIETYTMVRNIPIRSTASTTLKKQLMERGLEPDESYYITHERTVRGLMDLDLQRDPPPDLAIEVEISRSAINKLDIYGDLGVPEVWFYDGDAVRMEVRQPDGSYAPQLASSELPELTVDVVEAFLARTNESDETTWVGTIYEWARKLGE
jgi:Uma2 family endonuclease